MQEQNSHQGKLRKKKKRPWLIFISVFIFTLFILLLGVGYFVSRNYSQWRDDFENTRLSTDFFNVGSDEYSTEGDSLDLKLEEFQESDELVDFVELSAEEVVVLFNRTVFDTDKTEWQVMRYAYENEEATWTIYAEVMYKKRLLPWLVFKIHKDPVESPELYLEDLSIGGFSLDSFGFGYIRDNMNLGYSDAMNSINESGFTNRTWENIELESDTMIIKGEKLEEEV
jgi:hypothetical protein